MTLSYTFRQSFVDLKNARALRHSAFNNSLWVGQTVPARALEAATDWMDTRVTFFGVQIMKVALTYFLSVALAAVSIAIADANESSTESAMTSIFDPSRAPERRTMGLLQRNFLDLVEEANPRLEIALVIDGTDSMDSALVGVRNALNQMVQDLRRYRDNIGLQIVVYRDIASPSGEVTLPLNISNNDFTPNLDLVREALDNLKPESGKPFFHELVDLGLYEAITKLNWSQDDTTTRWILLFGDAPPLDEQWSDEKTSSKRRYSTKRLVTKAREKDIPHQQSAM